MSGRGDALERRYRRLLAAYPAEHRRVHGEEMVGVLLAGARPGRVRVGLGESLNLIGGGLRIRLRARAAFADGEGWRGDLATFSVACPVFLLAATCWSYLADVQFALIMPPLISVVIGLVFIGQLPVALLVLRRLRRVAACVAACQAVAVVLILLTRPAVGSGFRGGTLIVGYVGTAALSLAEAVVLLASAGPRAGLPLMSPRRWAAVLTASIPAAALAPTFILIRTQLSRFALVPSVPKALWILAAACASLGVLVLSTWLSSASGKRLTVLFVIVVAYPYLLVTVTVATAPFWSPQTGIAIIAPALVVCCAPAVAIQWLDRSPPVGSSTANSQDRGPDGGTLAG